MCAQFPRIEIQGYDIGRAYPNQSQNPKHHPVMSKSASG
jgi:hypothetical protein